MDLLRGIERYLRRSGVSASAFGRAVMKDPAFVRQLRNGRELRPETIARIESFLDEAERVRKMTGCAR